jgi:cell division GTPase FtsZ
VLFSAGELSVASGVGENVVDASELSNTLDTGGISSVGHATERVQRQGGGLLARFRTDGAESPEPGTVTDRIVGLVRQATRGRLTLPCDVESTARALLVVSGPPDLLSRRGTELGREWLAEATGTLEVRGGDHPIPEEERVSATVVLAGVTSVPRIEALQRAAVDTQANMREQAASRDEDLRALLADEYDEIEPLI